MKFPQLSKFVVTYPLPVRIEMTLNETALKLTVEKLLLNNIKYKNKINIEKKIILRNYLICVSV